MSETQSHPHRTKDPITSTPTAAPDTLPSRRAATADTRPRREILRSRAKDLLLASDPGFNRAIQALQLVAAIGITIGLLYAFEQATHLLWIAAPAGAPAAVAAELAVQHQGITLLAMMLGGIVAMLSSIAVMEPRPREQALTMALMPVPMLATMALALWVASDHVLGLALLAVVMGVGTYLRKFVPTVGPRAFLGGVLLFIGYFFGFLSGGAIELSQLDSIAVVLWLAVAINLAFKLAVANPLAQGRLARTRSSFRARARGVLTAAVAVLEADSEDQRRKAAAQLHRRLARMNETALVIDGLIADPQTRGSGPAGRAHELIFELELLIGNVGRTSERLAFAGLPARLNLEIRGWLGDLRGGHAERAASAALALDDAPEAIFAGLTAEEVNRVRYLAEAVVELSTIVQRFEAAPPEEEVTFESPVTLVFGELPGSSLVSASTAAAPRPDGAGFLGRLQLTPPAQIAIRMTLAVAVAAAIGSVVSERRFYWAVLAVFITFMGTNTSGEQLDKAARRVAGTVIGIGLGSILAHAIGLSAWSIPVILAALGIGVYFMKVNYMVMTIGITVMVSQLYEQLGEYSDSLLLLRLAETSIGAVIAVVAALLIFPVNTRSAATTAARGYLDNLAELLGHTAARLEGDDDAPRLSSDSRALDSASQQLAATVRPLRRTTVRRDRLEHNLGLFTYVANLTRNLVATVEGHPEIDRDLAHQVAAALTAEQRRVATLEAQLEDGASDDAEPAEGQADTERSADGEADTERPADDAPETIGARLASAAIGPARPEHRLVQSVDRLHQAITDLTENLTPAH
jgi:uncharacterized membrane protein YccC